MRTKKRQTERFVFETDPGTAAMTDQCREYLESIRARRYSPATVRCRYDQLHRFMRYLAACGVTGFHQLSRTDLLQYAEALAADGLKPPSVEAYMRSVRLLFDRLLEHCQLFENPARGMTLHVRDERLPQVLSVRQVRRLLAAPDCSTALGQRDRAVLEVLYATGVRRAELAGLNVQDIDLRARSVRVLGKGRRERLLPLGKHAAAAVEVYLKHGRPKLLDPERPLTDALWISGEHRALAVGTVNMILRKCRRKAGLKKPVGPHCLRRSCATHMLANGANPMLVAKMLGHSTLHTLGRYLRVSITELTQTHSRTKPGT